MHITGRTQPLSALPLVKCLDELSRVGFAGVELCLEHPELSPDRLSLELAAAVRDHIQAFGMKHNAVSYHGDYIYDDQILADTRKAISYTPYFGTRIFVFSGAPARAGDDDTWGRMVARTRKLLEVAEDQNVTLAIEFEPGFMVGDTACLQRLFNEISSEKLRANLDLGHVFLCDPDPLAAINSLAGKVAHCHIENMKTGVHRHLPPDQGDMVLDDYLQALADIDFNGPLALDLYDGDYREQARHAVPILQKMLAAI